ncbi:type VI secretion system ImpA family N-terminal domain-containing protein [Burkholderia sp. JSH-S8]|nr:type VI secretion system ImpA family N-terminal domain-containing protein [Burkholderia sp. JSH-S8]
MKDTCARDSGAHFTDLLAPVSEDAPTGADLEYDPVFVMLQAAVAHRGVAQYGEFVDVPPPPNWTEIERDCRALLSRTKDIRLATILLRCRIRQAGALGLRGGLAFLRDLLARYGGALHPTLTFEGPRDATMYANAIAELADPDGVLGDARDIAMPKAPGQQLHLRDIEKAFAVPRQKDALAPESVSRLVDEWRSRGDATVLALTDIAKLVDELIAWCADTLDADAPDLEPFRKVLAPFAAATGSGFAAEPTPATVQQTESAAAERPAAPPATFSTDAQADAFAPPADDIQSTAPPQMTRWRALETIETVRRWFEQNEPSSPVVVLLRQSERMVGKRFSEIAHVIPADLLAKWDEAAA